MLKSNNSWGGAFLYALHFNIHGYGTRTRKGTRTQACLRWPKATFLFVFPFTSAHAYSCSVSSRLASSSHFCRMHWDYNYTKSSLKSLTTIMCQELRNIIIAYYASLGVKTTEIQQLLKKKLWNIIEVNA